MWLLVMKQVRDVGWDLRIGLKVESNFIFTYEGWVLAHNIRGCHYLPRSSVSYFVCRTASTQGNNPEVSTSEEVSVQFVFSYFPFQKTGHLAFGATWKSKPVQREWSSFVWWGRRGRGFREGGCVVLVYLCVCRGFCGRSPLLPVMLSRH